VLARTDGSVAIEIDGAVKELRGDLVIGADGVHSIVRESGDFGARIRATGIRYVRALVPSDEALGVEAWTSAGCLGSFRVDGGTYLFASCGTPALRAALEARDLVAFQRAWSNALPASAALLSAIPSWSTLLVNEVVCVDCRRFVDGPLVLLGDAAHAMAPNLGQGANSALVDAAVLSDELRAGVNLGAALVAYDRRRRPAVRLVADTAARIGRLAEVTHPAGRALRDRLLLPLLSKLSARRTTQMVLQESAEDLLAIGARLTPPGTHAA
jgi:2-polyprenyl-6-methoxyphenol hydroxylase-like FAD-dependent oxidoreductase